MPKEGTYARPAAVTQVDRGAGQNDVGIVAWLLTLKTPECPQGRQVLPPTSLAFTRHSARCRKNSKIL